MCIYIPRPPKRSKKMEPPQHGPIPTYWGGLGMCIYIYMGGFQNYGPFLGTLNIRGRSITGIQKWTIILTTTHITHYGSFHFLFHYPPIEPQYNPNITLMGTIILTTTHITPYSSFHFLFHYPPIEPQYNPNITLMGTIILPIIPYYTIVISIFPTIPIEPQYNPNITLMGTIILPIIPYYTIVISIFFSTIPIEPQYLYIYI